MNSQDFRNLQEAYLNVYEQEETLDEKVLGQDPESRKAGSEERKSGNKRLPPSSGKGYADNQKKSISYMNKLTKNNKIIPGMAHEEVEEFDEATAMAKRGKDETAIRNKIASSTGGGQSADRAGALADRPTYGQSGIDPKARANYARKQMGDFRKTNSSNPGLHGYGHKSNDPEVKSKQAARGAQRGSATLTPNEKKKLNMGEAYDLYDIILSHLIDEGYADTQEQAEVIMVNMSEEWRDSIIETHMDPRGRPASGPMNVYANPKKPSQAHLDAVKAYDAAQKKKTPEQKQKELDAYRNRKMYS